MTDTSIFTEDNILEKDYDNPGEKTFTDDKSESVVETLVGEGKKFKDIEALAKGKVLSDSFIEQLKEENRRMRDEKARLEAEMQSKTRLEEFMRELKNKGSSEMNSGVNQPDENPNDSKSVEVDYNAIVAKTLAEIEQRKRAEDAQTAISKVVNAAQKTYGSTWKEDLKKLGAEIGMDPETMDVWAKRNPDAVVKLITTAAPNRAEPTKDLSPTINSSGFNTQSPVGLRNYAYYNKIKAKDPVAFRNNKELQIQMHKDAQKLGDKFFE